MKSFDPVWEEIYSEGRQLNRYPYSNVVSFLYRYRRRDGQPSSVVEVGFGGGNNLWFAAREGFQVSGVEGSPSAVRFAKERFAAEGLGGDLRQGDFTQLPFPAETFDLAIDRAALSQTGRTSCAQAVAEIYRVLKPGGTFYSELYSDRGTSRGQPGPDGTLVDIEGPYPGVGQMRFCSRRDIADLFAQFRIESLIHVEEAELGQPPFEVGAYWCTIARKPDAV
jgi:SAM-dependent methyltransferase